jgi:hypothetical protein
VPPAGSQPLLCVCGHPCDVALDHVVLSGAQNVAACLTVSASEDVEISSPAAVVFRAGQSVSLGPSFRVAANELVTFAIQIDESLFCEESEDGDSDTWNGCADCDDGDSDIHPEATEVCNGEDDDCNGVADDVPLNTNPACPSATNLGSIEGDTDPVTPLQVSDIGEAWYFFELSEGNTSIGAEDLTARITLSSPPGVDYDLYVTCSSCGSGISASSSQGPGLEDVLEVHVDDNAGPDDTVFVIEVRYSSGAGCAPWSLQVHGDTDASADLTCN